MQVNDLDGRDSPVFPEWLDARKRSQGAKNPLTPDSCESIENGEGDAVEDSGRKKV